MTIVCVVVFVIHGVVQWYGSRRGGERRTDGCHVTSENLGAYKNYDLGLGDGYKLKYY